MPRSFSLGDAPPTRAPSTFGQAMYEATFSGLPEPPYWTRTFSATLDQSQQPQHREQLYTFLVHRLVKLIYQYHDSPDWLIMITDAKLRFCSQFSKSSWNLSTTNSAAFTSFVSFKWSPQQMIGSIPFAKIAFAFCWYLRQLHGSSRHALSDR